MLVLSIKVNERIQFGKDLIVTLSRVAGNRATLGIEAPDDVKILRGEIVEMLARHNNENNHHSPLPQGDRAAPPAGSSDCTEAGER